MRDGGELVLDSLNLDPGDGGSRKRTEKNTPHGIAEGHAETDLKRFGRESPI